MKERLLQDLGVGPKPASGSSEHPCLEQAAHPGLGLIFPQGMNQEPKSIHLSKLRQ